MRLPNRPFLAVAITAAAVLAGGALSVIPNAAADASTTASSSAASSAECAPNAAGTTPSVAVQNACGDHAMGGGLQASVSAPTATPAPTAGSTTPGATTNSEQAPLMTAQSANTSSYVKGFDISYYQGGQTDWSAAASSGYKFVFIKSTEGTSYVNSYFNSQWVSAGKSGLLRGTYHFARPHLSGGAAQAEYFYANGASMSSTTPGTLPPVIDLESTPDGECSGLSKAGMVSWISSFMSTLKSLTGRTPIIYTAYNWWYDCTGDNAALAKAYPLWMAYYPTNFTSTSAPALPAAWKSWVFWQWGGTPTFTGGGDADMFESSSLATLTSSYGTYLRNAGTDRYATSTSVAQQFLAAAKTSTGSVKPGQTVYIASGTNFPDALSGAAAAGQAQAPILLVQSDWISSAVANQLWAIRPKKIVILGGTSAIDSAVQKALAGYTASGSASAVTRVAGSDRYATSADVATSSFSAGVANAYVAVGTNWPDALSGAAVAASPAAAGPILLVQNNSIPGPVASALSKLRPKKITVFGGGSAVDSNVSIALTKYTASKSSSSVVRYGGANRFGTSALIAERLFGSGVPVAYAADGLNFPDALSGAPLSALTGGAPVLLTNPGAVPANDVTALKALKPKSIVVLGGASAVSASVQSALQKYVVP